MIVAKHVGRGQARWRVLCGILSLCWVGCFQSQSYQVGSRYSPFQRFNGPEGSDVVFVESALLQTNLGDEAIDQEIWATADDLVLPPETRAALKANGLRVAQVGGIMPAALMKLLTDPHTCIKAHRHVRRSGGPIELPVAGERPCVEFVYHDGTAELPQHYRSARFVVRVVPRCDKQDNITLEVTPQLFHGERKLCPEAGPSGGEWSIVGKQELFSDPRLKCTLTVGLNEYVLIGGYAEEPFTFGGQGFTGRDGNRAVQWAIALRTGRMPSNQPLQESQASGIVPLALQAARPTNRH